MVDDEERSLAASSVPDDHNLLPLNRSAHSVLFSLTCTHKPAEDALCGSGRSNDLCGLTGWSHSFKVENINTENAQAALLSEMQFYTNVEKEKLKDSNYPEPLP